MKTLKIWGASDDLLETSGLPGCDEFNVYGNGPLMGKLTVKGKGMHLHIYALYDGAWSFAIGTQEGDDCDEFPGNQITRRWGNDSPYSETVLIECPPDAILAFSKK